jgi:hypothetical protein
MKVQSAPQEFFVAGGTLWREAPSYIVRPADNELFRLALAGEYCDVLAARQMGKSSLMVRSAKRLQENGVRSAILDISTLGGGLSTPEAWFFGFLDELAVQLDLNEDVDAWWEAHANHNPVQRFNNFIRDVVLVEIQSPIAIFVDEIDSALGLDFTDDFFAAIRAAYNARASEVDFQRLTFILLGVARPADLIRNPSRTPYNIGTHIHLSDFTLPELQPFQNVLEAVFPGQGKEIVEWVLEWTNGQPYLTQKLCATLMQEPEKPCTQESVAQTVQRLFFTEEARKESNLRAIRDRIEGSPNKIKMLQIYDSILEGKPVPDEERSPAKNELKLTGLVRPIVQGQSEAGDDEAISGEVVRGGPARLEVRNRIYRTVFDQEWVQRGLPRSRTNQVVVLAALLAILAFTIAGYALYRQQIQPALTYSEQFQTSNSPEVKLTSLARLLELDARSQSEAHDLYSGLSQSEKLSLFDELSNPQNVGQELVTVIEAFYQDNPNNPDSNAILSAMKTVLGKIGAAGAPGLKTEIEFWLKGREEITRNRNALTAVSYFASAWDESVSRKQPNYSVRFDRAMGLIALDAFGSAFDDLQAVWEEDPARQEEIETVINANPDLAAYVYKNPTAIPAILALITPVIPSATVEPSETPRPTTTQAVIAAATQSPTPTPAPTPEPISPYKGWITFGLGDGNGREIYIMNPATGVSRHITYNGVIDEAPSFSPDNWKIVYDSNRSQNGWQLYAYDLSRGTEEQLTAFDGQAHFPVWSPAPGDTRIVFEGRTYYPEYAINIWMVDIATGELEQLTTDGADSRPGWSPDGTKILFSRATLDTNGDGRITTNDDSDIYTLDLATGEVKNLTNTPAYNEFNFAWSPDGQWIVFTSVRGDANGDGVVNLSDSRDLFLIPSDGGEERRLDLGGRMVFSPSWSPDGRFILVMVVNADGQSEIWRYDTQSGNLTRLSEPGTYHNPRYSN